MAKAKPIPPRHQTVAWDSHSVNEWLRRQMAASGHDPAVVQDEEFRLLRLSELKRRVGLSRQAIYRRIKAGSFPSPIRLAAPALQAP